MPFDLNCTVPTALFGATVAVRSTAVPVMAVAGTESDVVVSTSTGAEAMLIVASGAPRPRSGSHFPLHRAGCTWSAPLRATKETGASQLSIEILVVCRSWRQYQPFELSVELRQIALRP